MGFQAKSLILLDAVFRDFRESRLPEPRSDFFNGIGQLRQSERTCTSNARPFYRRSMHIE